MRCESTCRFLALVSALTLAIASASASVVKHHDAAAAAEPMDDGAACTAGNSSPQDCESISYGYYGCTWNNFTQTCMPHCGGLGPTTCETVSACRFNPKTSSCMFSCPFKGRTAEACYAQNANFPELPCFWNPNVNLCENFCPYPRAEPNCVGDSACNFNANKLQCYTTCYGNAVPESCLQDPSCTWVQDAKPYPVCQPGNQSSIPAAKMKPVVASKP